MKDVASFIEEDYLLVMNAVRNTQCVLAPMITMWRFSAGSGSAKVVPITGMIVTGATSGTMEVAPNFSGRFLCSSPLSLFANFNVSN